jgi:hypothetical protein
MAEMRGDAAHFMHVRDMIRKWLVGHFVDIPGS